MKKEKDEKEEKKIIKKFLELKNDLSSRSMEDFIDNNLQGIFNCDLVCSTCTEEEKNRCLQDFKKVTLFLVMERRKQAKLVQGIVDDLGKVMSELSTKTKNFEEKIKIRKLKKEAYDLYS